MGHQFGSIASAACMRSCAVCNIASSAAMCLFVPIRVFRLPVLLQVVDSEESYPNHAAPRTRERR